MVGGANNLVLLFEQGSARWIVKRYAEDAGDKRDRLGAESRFLRYAQQAAPGVCPALGGVDPGAKLALLSYIDGCAMTDTDITVETVTAAAAFLSALNQPHMRSQGEILEPAADAAFSATHHMALIDARVGALVQKAVGTSETEGPLREMLGDLQRHRDAASDLARNAVKRGEIEDRITRAQQIISPSDFGFHNALMTAEGLRFIDFEYAGWDDPAKTLSDVFLQPRLVIGRAWRELFLKESGFADPERAAMVRRADILAPLFAVKWACIVLRPLLPDYKAGRVTFESTTSRPALLAERLKRARNILNAHTVASDTKTTLQAR
jgi:hypothetical protein